MDDPYPPYPPPPPPPGPPAMPYGWEQVQPGVVVWFIVYCVVMALLYLFVAGVGGVILLVDPRELDMDPLEAKIVGGVYLGMGLVLFLPFAVGPFLGRRKWVWVYDLVLICLGMTSCCTLPACIALLLFWIKPDTKLYYGWT